mmetsp:Transcript_61253/g.145828  ORF Transcript_61253/g.145828 Transcript_61253/m.145828 type:complete len:788 (-) Transcript_61253:160-2523(-)|eukprot:CAMPEP_0178427082 /NCGR_PEP_ID=MMETSP0689_2-20121128/29561_1 /TAXON_ID=160604 /ORGANISM="Amphidinium massartii, Strain CS-259" /LENGTH=787 /DNA_ID=CAMNT_0020048777 /DNA_START=18 /DNA_END=2381 /DNA_ORIENTATION=+
MVSAGPLGFWDALILLSPIAFLVAMVLKPNPMPTTQSLWLAAILLFIIKLWYLESSPLEACACFIKGCLQAITPCSIVAGAIFLFDCMESSQCLAWMKVQLRVVTNSHPVAEVMLIGFCFAFIVEGASGFGTPAALAAPMLYSMGHPKQECVICLLTFNTFMTIFGAVGTPVWFGIGEVVSDYEESNLVEVGFRSAMALTVCAILIVPYVVGIIVPWDELKPSWLFILLSTLSVVLPFMGFSFFTYEFPSMAAGIVGLCITAALTIFRIGLGPHKRGTGQTPAEAGSEVKEPKDVHDEQQRLTEGSDATAAAAAAAPPQSVPGPPAPAPLAEDGAKKWDSDFDFVAIDLDDIEAAQKQAKLLAAMQEQQQQQQQQEQPPPAAAATAAPAPAPAKKGIQFEDDPQRAVSGSQPQRVVSAGTSSEPQRVVSGDDNPKRAKSSASGGDKPAREVSRWSQQSGKSLKDRAVNADVVLSKKDLKKLAKRTDMTVAPAQVISALGDDDEIPQALTVNVNDEEAEHFNKAPTVLDAVLRTMPLWLTVLLLILTRIEPIGLKDVLREDTPTIVDGSLGNIGYLSISTVGRFSLTKILGTKISWTYELLYTPFILPFIVAGCAPLIVFRNELSIPPTKVVGGVLRRIKGPAIALAGALMLVELLRNRDDDPLGKDSPAVIVGTRLSETLSDGFVALSFPLGALGSFFSGSTTVSMLTFTQVQKVAADELGLTSEALIALQLCGASAGNAFCLANIIAATAVIGLQVSEGAIIKRVLLPVFAMYVICTAVLVPFVYA